MEHAPPAAGPYEALVLETDEGDIDCRFYEVPGSRLGAIWVGGVGGGFDTPAQGLYPRLSEELMAEGISSLRIRYRDPHSLEESVYDVLAGIAFLDEQGVASQALIGHSLGGAVVIQAAAESSSVRPVVALSTQSYGADPAGQLSPHCSLLLVHGLADRILPASASMTVHRWAQEPKRLVLLPNTGHVLDETADEVYGTVKEWVRSELKKPA